jgi:hypothetical protein
MAKRRRLIADYDSEDVNDEFYENCKEDREKARQLFAIITEQLEKGIISIEEGGATALKAVEVMQKSNEQLMRLSQAITKKPIEEDFSPTKFLANLQSEEEVEQEIAALKKD